MDPADLRAALSHPNVAAFYMAVRAGESSLGDDAYRMRYNGPGKKPAFFDSFADHPRIFVDTGKGTKSSAAGAPQATATTWDEERAKYGWKDFSPQSQDEFYVARLVYRKALDAVKSGRFDEACRLCKNEWTSLPGGPEENSATSKARETYLEWGGQLKAPPKFQDILDAIDKPFDPDTLSTEHYGDAVTESTIRPIPSADEQEEHNMAAPLIPIAIAAAQAFLPRLVELIPALGAAFGSGSEVQKRNVAGAAMIADAVTKTVGEKNLQAAIEELERNPAKLAEARAAVADILPTLIEAGGGGIKGARDNAAAQSGDWRKLIFSLPFVGIILFTPAIWAVVAASVFKAPWLLEMDPQLRGTVIGFVMGTLAGSICGYVFGSSMTKAPAQPFTAR